MSSADQDSSQLQGGLAASDRCRNAMIFCATRVGVLAPTGGVGGGQVGGYSHIGEVGEGGACT